ncbi:hypothetical protein [Leptolyngbya sp. PCC 6406]|uniref:hypothetical protein n=1 Tax=Leptolyngbya sp. PCC 6406 TaxID=1173264 RepID=UPI0002AC8C1C|nr:hypothetical protein [Leptolyngbya sp. PCC 6406]
MTQYGYVQGAILGGLMWGGFALAAQADEYQVPVSNLSGQDLQYLYIAPSTSDTWGEDLLYQVIPDQEEMFVAVPRNGEDCLYDVLGLFAPAGGDGTLTSQAILPPIDLCLLEAEAEVVFLPETLATFEETFAYQVPVVNFSGQDLQFLYIAPSTSDTWGENLLYQAIPDQEVVDVAVPFSADDCNYDVLGLFAPTGGDGTLTSQAILSPIDLCLLEAEAEAVVFLSETLDTLEETFAYQVPVFNFSGQNLLSLYISPSASDTWGEDFLYQPIPDQEVVDVAVPYSGDDCIYDVAGLFAPAGDDGTLTRQATFWLMDLCLLEAEEDAIVFLPNDLYHPEDSFIRVINTNNSTVLALVVAPAGEPTTVENQIDLLGQVYLGPYEHFQFPLSLVSPDLSQCDFDITGFFLAEGVDISGELTERDVYQGTVTTVDLCNTEQIPIGNGPTQRVTIQNTTDMFLSELYISPSESETWGLDQLMFDLGPSEDFVVLIPISATASGDCATYDVLGIFYTDSDSPSALSYDDRGINWCHTDDAILNFANPDGLNIEITN